MDNATHHFSPLARGMIHPQPTYLQSLPQIQDAMPPATEALDIHWTWPYRDDDDDNDDDECCCRPRKKANNQQEESLYLIFRLIRCPRRRCQRPNPPNHP